jgi:hypothetical protein
MGRRQRWLQMTDCEEGNKPTTMKAKQKEN